MASTLFSPTSRVFTPRPLSSPPPFPMAASFFLSTHFSQTLTIRSGITLIIDKEGIIQHPTITNLAIGRSLPKTLRPLQSLQYVQENPDKVCPSSDPNFPSKFTHLRLKHPLSHSLSAKTTTRTSTPTTTSTTTSLPLTPPKVPILPSNPHPQHPISIKAPPNPNPNPDPDFHTKALFLDSIGVDSLSLLSHHNSGTAIAAAMTTASLSDLKTVFEYLTSFEFSNEDLNRMISMCPQILTLRLRDISAVFAFLLREANVSATDLRRVVHRRPRLLVSPVESRLRPTMYFLQSIGIHEVHRHTHLLSCSVEDKYIPKIEYFQKVGFQYRETISMFRRFPALFCYSVKGNFEPKFNYFVMEMGRELKELKEFPQYFSFSLEKRIKPRHQSCVENGVCFPLPVMLKMKEEDFRQRLDACHDSSIPRSSSPLWCANHCDVDTM